MKQGEVWQVHLPVTTGREQSGTRPAVVLQNEVYGAGSPLTLIALVTSRSAAARFPGTVRIDPSTSNGLVAPSIVMVFQTRAHDPSRFVRRLSALDEAEIRQVLAELHSLTSLIQR